MHANVAQINDLHMASLINCDNNILIFNILCLVKVLVVGLCNCHACCIYKSDANTYQINRAYCYKLLIRFSCVATLVNERRLLQSISQNLRQNVPKFANRFVKLRTSERSLEHLGKRFVKSTVSTNVTEWDV